MSDEPGFEIGGEFYAFPQAFRLCDPVLVAEVTGLSWIEFTELLDEQDPRTLSGLVAVAVWQKNPRWKRDKVIQFVERVELDAIGFSGSAAEDDAGPPDLVAPEVTGDSIASSTLTSDELEASDATLDSTGLPASAITSG